MDVQRAIEIYHKRSAQEKTEFLLRLAHTLTILARDTYEVGGDSVTEPARLRRISELLHRVLGSLLASRRDNRKRYPDDVLVRLILEHPEDLELQLQLERAFERLLGELSAA
jgi:hypothetical protein